MILHRYLVKEISQAFLATLLVLLLIIVGNTVARLLGNVSSGDLPVDVLGMLVLIGSVKGAIQLAPVALLIGMMLALGRLYRDNEMSALHASGAGPGELYKAISKLLIPLTLLMAVLVLFVVPELDRIRQDVRTEVKQRPEASGIPVGEFMHSRSGGRSFTVFVGAYDEDDVVMNNFFLHTDDAEESRVMLAEEALLYVDKNNGERLLQIRDGKRYDQNKASGGFTLFTFKEHGIRIPALTTNTGGKLGAETTLGLLTSNDPRHNAELHWRIGVILSAPVMALLALPLSYTTPRQGRFGKLALGILLYAIYANLMITGQSLLEDSKIPAILGLWWVHLPFLLLTVWLVKQRYGSKAA